MRTSCTCACIVCRDRCRYLEVGGCSCSVGCMYFVVPRIWGVGLVLVVPMVWVVLVPTVATPTPIGCLLVLGVP